MTHFVFITKAQPRGTTKNKIHQLFFCLSYSQHRLLKLRGEGIKDLKHQNLNLIHFVARL